MSKRSSKKISKKKLANGEYILANPRYNCPSADLLKEKLVRQIMSQENRKIEIIDPNGEYALLTKLLNK